MKRVSVLALWLLYTASIAFAQPVVRALLRMERAQPGETVCTLVNENGSYRIEKVFQTKKEMYVGSIDPSRVDQLRSILANQQLSKLSQSDIHNPLVADTADDIQIAIRRENSWQELLFFAPAGRKPFKDSIEPLLRWFQDLQKQHPSAARDGTQTRCIPPPESQIIIRSAPAGSPSPAAVQLSPYFFRVRSGHFYKGRVDSSCTIVFEDGRFHREHGGQTYMANRQNKVSEGQLDQESIQELKELLNTSALKESPGNSGPGGQVVSEDMWTELAIPRGSAIQNLIFVTTFNTFGDPHEIGGKNNLSYHVADRKLLSPLNEWMKLRVDKLAHGAETDAPGNDCEPSTDRVQGQKSGR